MLSHIRRRYRTHQKQMKEIEKVQQKATSSILNKVINYKETLYILIILPLSMYIQLHDVHFLQPLMEAGEDLGLSRGVRNS